MFISLESFHTNADTALLTLLCSQQGRSSTIICQQCTRIFHSSIATCREGFDILTVVPFVMPAPYRRGDKQLYEYIVRAPEAGLKAHRCTLCGQTGNDRSNLRKHVENIHFPGTFSYTCKYCPPGMAVKTFPTRTKLQNHVSSFHKSFPLSSSD